MTIGKAAHTMAATETKQILIKQCPDGSTAPFSETNNEGALLQNNYSPRQWDKVTEVAFVDVESLLLGLSLPPSCFPPPVIYQSFSDSQL